MDLCSLGVRGMGEFDERMKSWRRCAKRVKGEITRRVEEMIEVKFVEGNIWCKCLAHEPEMRIPCNAISICQSDALFSLLAVYTLDFADPFYHLLKLYTPTCQMLVTKVIFSKN